MNQFTAHAPGRVELLGNHTDYNDGFVLSAAIDRGVTLSGQKTDDGKIHLRSQAMPRQVEIDLQNIQRQSDDSWANYPLGVVNCLSAEGFAVGGFTAEISSDLPSGAGLSSSAALEVATAVFLKKLFRFELEPMQLAKICRRAENEFVGVNCGLLDQVSSVFGKKQHAIFLDCREETVEIIAFPSDVALLIIHSGVAHRLVGGEYNERRAQCFDAAEKLGARALREVSNAQLEAAKNSLPLLSYQRAAHIVGENERVLRGVDFLKSGDVKSFGKLMAASHESSRTNFENSTPELDALVEIALAEPGVLGSRLTGGGFGGATVSLVQREDAAGVAEKITQKYRTQTGNVAETHLCEIADGAR